VKLSNEVNQNVPVVETAKENVSKPEAAKSSLDFQFPEPPVLKVDLSKLNPDMLNTAKSIGIPLDAILQYITDLQTYNAESAQLIKAIYVNFDSAVQNSVGKMLAESQKKQQAVLDEREKAEKEFYRTHPEYNRQQMLPAQAAPSGGGGLNGLAASVLQNPQLIQQLLSVFTGGGGSGSLLGEEFQKQLTASLAESALGDFVLGKTIRMKVVETLGANIGKGIGEKALASVTPV
jgi:hypothetical protein